MNWFYILFIFALFLPKCNSSPFQIQKTWMSSKKGQEKRPKDEQQKESNKKLLKDFTNTLQQANNALKTFPEAVLQKKQEFETDITSGITNAKNTLTKFPEAVLKEKENFLNQVQSGINTAKKSITDIPKSFMDKKKQFVEKISKDMENAKSYIKKIPGMFKDKQEEFTKNIQKGINQAKTYINQFPAMIKQKKEEFIKNVKGGVENATKSIKDIPNMLSKKKDEFLNNISSSITDTKKYLTDFPNQIQKKREEFENYLKSGLQEAKDSILSVPEKLLGSQLPTSMNETKDFFKQMYGKGKDNIMQQAKNFMEQGKNISKSAKDFLQNIPNPFSGAKDYLLSNLPEVPSEPIQEIASAISDAANQAVEVQTQEQNQVSEVKNNLPSTDELIEDLEKNNLEPGEKKEVILDADTGSNDVGSFKPSSVIISEDVVEQPTTGSEEETEGAPQVFNYPSGPGSMILKGCFGSGYKPDDPCSKVKIPAKGCSRMLDAAAFIGIGFDGRGYYNAKSRKMTLIQVKCDNRRYYMNRQLPDNMNAFGIYKVDSETRSFSSSESYSEFLDSKSQSSSQEGMFEQEKSQYSSSDSSSGNLGIVGEIAGTAAGAYVSMGNPDAVKAAAAAGKAVGETVGFTAENAEGNANSNSKKENKGKKESKSEKSEEQKSTSSCFAILFINVMMYELTLDNSSPEYLSEEFLQDYLDMPDSYYAIGGTIKYQQFLLRYGSHYIRSAEFGGELKIVKTMKSEKKMKMTEFSDVAEKEFKAITNSLQSESSSSSSSSTAVGLSAANNEAKKSKTAKKEQNAKKEKNEKKGGGEESEESQFTQTTVEAQGGDPIIAKALFEFYSPTFKNLFGDWLMSLPDYLKPFVFQMRGLDDILDINMDSMFPAGNSDFGCTEHNSRKLSCRYKSLDHFRRAMSRKVKSVERAITIYMTEGPSPSSSFYLKGGKPGCELDTLASVGLAKNNKSDSNKLTYFKLKTDRFKVQFGLPYDIPKLLSKDATIYLVHMGNKWYSLTSDSASVSPQTGCLIPESSGLKYPVCINGLIFTYDNLGTLIMTKSDFELNSKIVPNLNPVFKDFPVANVREISVLNSSQSEDERKGAIPCNVVWSNKHSLDITKNHTCISFIAATESDIFVIFAVIPKQHSTWYYVQINYEGIGIYKGTKLVYSRIDPGIGTLGDTILYDSFFVCVYHLKDNNMIIQYGKSTPGTDYGMVLAAKHFNNGGHREDLRFYSFGVGEKDVNILDIELMQYKLENIKCDDYWILHDGACYIDCHKECKKIGECDKPRDSSACHECKNFKIKKRGKYFCVETCPAGYAESELEDKFCELCPNGTYKAESGIHPCILCQRGFYNPNVGAKACSPCPVGMISDSEGLDSCQLCPKGHFSAKKGGSVCARCPAGKFSKHEGGSDCMPCPPGTMADIEGSYFCKDCREGHFSTKKASTKCKPCPKGYEQPKTGRISCLICEAGHFTNETGSKICLKCPRNTYQKHEGRSRCHSCPPDTNSTFEGAVSCNGNCGPGTFSPNNNNKCENCENGTYQRGSGASECKNCRKGTYQPNTGQIECLEAPNGTYVNIRGSSFPFLCPNGTANKKERSISVKDCIACSTGTYAKNAGSALCEKCEPGEFQDKEQQTGCDKCPKGFYSKTPGSQTCKKCPSGTVSNLVGAKSCSVCESGTIPLKGEKCVPCGVGKHSWKRNENDLGENMCLDCPEGTYNNKPKWNKKCPPCPRGAYANKKGSEKCTDCKPGTKLISPRTGCQKCSMGEYQPKKKQLKCEICKKGSYSNAGASKCTLCPKGFHQKDRGQGKCEKCLPGFYSSKNGTISCNPCLEGSYAKSSGSIICSKCKAGYIQPLKSQMKCLACSPGYFSLEGAVKCEKCPTGSYQDRSGQGKCNKCPAGTFSDVLGSASCKKCPKNYYLDKEGGTKCLKCKSGTKSKAGSPLCNGCNPGEEYGRINFAKNLGKPGSKPEPKKEQPAECAFFGEKCSSKYGMQYWESKLSQIWPKFLFFKFNTAKRINGFYIDTVETKAPINTKNFLFYGTNDPDCTKEKSMTVLYVARNSLKGVNFKNTKSFRCYGFLFKKYGDEKSAAVRYPIRFFQGQQSKCQPCKQGEYQPADGGSICLSCPPGYFVNKAMSKSCSQPCDTGTMANKPVRAEKCLSCPPGSYNDVVASKTCYACKPGTRSLTAGSKRCEKCIENWFNSFQGQKHCAACAYGCASKPGATKCYEPDPTYSGCKNKYMDVMDSESHGGQTVNLLNSNSMRKAIISYYNLGSNPGMQKLKDKLYWYNEKARLKELPYWNNGKGWGKFKQNPYKFPLK